jgi:acyl dehydratase
MALNRHLIGVESEPTECSWTASDVQLYALAVGAGQQDPTAELQFTTDNTREVPLQVLPTFANIMSARSGGAARLGDFARSQYVHAEQAFTLHKPLRAEGSVRTTSKVIGMYDKGHAALIVSESIAMDVASGTPWVTSRSSIFVKGEGGFGGPRGPVPEFSVPDGPPDVQVTVPTRPEQALLYRLTGDRNPLHSDPKFAAEGGFERPILHGLCTYGFTGRALVHAICGSEPGRVRSMEARFSHPVFPGDELVVSAWVSADGAYFRTSSNGRTVLDRGRLVLT